MLSRVLIALSLALPLAAAAAPPVPASASQRAVAPDVAELVNEAGRLRMLAERMGKAYGQVALGLQTDKAREQMAEAQKRYADNLALLERGAATPAQKSALETVRTTYASYLKVLAAPPGKDNLAAAFHLTDRLVAAADTLTSAFEERGAAANAKIVNLSGRQRMLSQRLARKYFAQALGLGNADIEKDRAEFRKALAALEAAPLSNPDIRREIELAKTQWVFFEYALADIGHTGAHLLNVATASERLLETMDKLTTLYGKSLKILVGSAGKPAPVS